MVEAAVISIPEEKWTERPLACVVVSQDTDPMTFAAFLEGKARAASHALVAAYNQLNGAPS